MSTRKGDYCSFGKEQVPGVWEKVSRVGGKIRQASAPEGMDVL